jgi:hypothetical protein
LSEWRIALDLDATRAIRAAVPPPPCRRECAQCRNWTASYAAVLPPALRSELRRVGIDPAAPTDLYAYVGREPLAYRVMYHVAGRILSGPAPGLTDPAWGRMQSYHPVSAGARRLSLRVLYDDEAGLNPGGPSAGMSPLIQVDFRLDVPWMLNEPRPEPDAPAPPKLTARQHRLRWRRGRPKEG